MVQKTVEEILVVCTTAEWSIELIARTVVGVAVDMSGQDVSNVGVYVFSSIVLWSFLVCMPVQWQP